VLRVDRDGRVRITIPRGGSQREAKAFAARHEEWIERQRARVSQSMVAAYDVRAMKLRARAELPARLVEIGAGFGLQAARVSIRNQRTRWGSCGRDGHICLNWRLVLMPEWVRDYVLVHELMHLACPRYREARVWLRKNGPGLR
jgi:predicted metal-dependent hydrolase